MYGILQQSDMCTYYQLNDKPGANQRIQVRKEKFAFLDDTNIAQKLIHFTDGKQSHVTFYLPQIHCSSCLWLLEHIYKIEPGIISARVHFTKKEVDIVFEHNKVSLRKVAETLTSIGYEPYISLQNLQGTDKVRNNSLTYQLGIAGFCFANVMLLSFPEYLG
ncbi:MAG TPA: heavy metal translocating P-type ATPase, partial [Chitinophagaceae bacterium]|nr:heavy metal translocating P-type ATPase [Chitinophagaceae bacterium]